MQSNQVEIKAADNSTRRVVCVDLDNTLLATDTLWECVAACLRSYPALLLMLPFWLAKGRARLKTELARRVSCDVESLPVNECVLQYAHEEKCRGALIVLATAAPIEIANLVASRFPVIDEVVASDARKNMKGAAKAAELVRRFGRNEFTYVGDAYSDLPVWKMARDAVTVGVSADLLEKVKGVTCVSRVLQVKGHSARDYFRLARVYQWVKNILVFAPALASGLIADTETFFISSLAFLAMSFVASGLYIVNDLVDLPADRAHPGKRNRPIANGTVGIGRAALFSIVLLLAGSSLSLWIGISGLIGVYAGASILYSIVLKQLPLIDTFALAGLYVLRIVVGGEATGIGVSIWLLAFSGFVFLALAMVKRVAEFYRVRELGQSVRGYVSSDEGILMAFGIASSFASTVVLSLYIASEDVLKVYDNAGILWGLVPLMLFWQCHLWLAVSRGRMEDDPIVYAVKDWVSIVLGVTACLVILAAHVSAL